MARTTMAAQFSFIFTTFQIVLWFIARFSSVIVPNLVGASGVTAANLISEIVVFDRAGVVNSIMGIFFIQSVRRR
jgi:cytochrome c biogenesis protein CcdA